MLMPILAVLGGLALLVWSADRFVDGAAATAKNLGVPTLLIGMVIIGFGTSAPEMMVSGLAASQGSPGLALGNAIGSNITNIALILGLTALLAPIKVESGVLRVELPLLALATLVVGYLMWDQTLSQTDGALLLLVFALIIGWTIYRGFKSPADTLEDDVDELLENAMPLRSALLWLVVGLILLLAGSRILVWGAVEIALSLGISDLIIGLTIVAIGTSLPELAASIAAVRKQEHDLAIGNVIGSNLFNTLAVIGIAASIHPISFDSISLTRDFSLMAVLTAGLFVLGYGVLGRRRINRFEGALLMLVYFVYLGTLVSQTLSGAS